MSRTHRAQRRHDDEGDDPGIRGEDFYSPGEEKLDHGRDNPLRSNNQWKHSARGKCSQLTTMAGSEKANNQKSENYEGHGI